MDGCTAMLHDAALRAGKCMGMIGPPNRLQMPSSSCNFEEESSDNAHPISFAEEYLVLEESHQL